MGFLKLPLDIREDVLRNVIKRCSVNLLANSLARAERVSRSLGCKPFVGSPGLVKARDGNRLMLRRLIRSGASRIYPTVTNRSESQPSSSLHRGPSASDDIGDLILHALDRSERVDFRRPRNTPVQDERWPTPCESRTSVRA
jgi:hypothetical protein